MRLLFFYGHYAILIVACSLLLGCSDNFSQHGTEKSSNNSSAGSLENEASDAQTKLQKINELDSSLQIEMEEAKNLIENVGNGNLDLDDLLGGIIPGVGDIDGLEDIFDESFLAIKQLVDEIRARSDELAAKIDDLKSQLGTDPQSEEMRERLDEILARIGSVEMYIQQGIVELQALCAEGKKALEEVIADLDPSEWYEALAILKLQELIRALDNFSAKLATL